MKNFYFKKMSKPKIINVTFIDPYESNNSQDPDFIPSQTPESEDYTSYESSSLETSSESDYSIACSIQCSGSSDLPSSYFSDSQSSTDSDSQQI